MALTEREPEIDTLGHLEDRIQRAVALVVRLRAEKDSALTDLAAARVALEEAELKNLGLSEEIEGLQAERQQVRNRLEKLLGHIDQLGAA